MVMPFRCESLSTTTNSTGMMNTAIKVAASIPPITVVPMIWRATDPAPLAVHNGTQPSTNANEVIRMCRKRNLAPPSAASTSGCPFSYASFANSTIRMAFFAASPISITSPICEYTSVSICTKYGHGRAQQNAEWQRPAFIQGREDQKNHQQREPKNGCGRHALLGYLLLEGYADVVVSHFRRHGLCKDLFQGCHGLCRAESRRGTAKYLRGAVEVVAHGEFRPGARLKSCQRSQRHHVTFSVPDIELSNVLRAVAIGALSLDIHLPLPAKSIEIVDERSSHERLDRSINVLDVNALLEHFVPVDSDELLRHSRKECGVDGGEFRSLPGCCKELVQIAGKKFNVFSRAVLKHKREAPGGTHAGNGGRRKRKRNPLWETSKFPVYVLSDELILLFPFLAVLPFLQSDEEERGVTRPG